MSVLFSTPLVFIAGSHRVQLAEPPLASNEEVTHGLDEVVGPTGQGGRPGRSVGLPRAPTTPTSSHGLSWASSCLNAGACLVLTEFGLVLGLHLVHLSLNCRSDIFCDFISGQSVLATCILAPKHNLHFLKGKVWFRNYWIRMRVRNANSHDFLIKLTPGNDR